MERLKSLVQLPNNRGIGLAAMPKNKEKLRKTHLSLIFAILFQINLLYSIFSENKIVEKLYKNLIHVFTAAAASAHDIE